MELVAPKQYLEWVADRLSAAGVYCGHGTDDTWDEAAHLVLYALGLSAGASYEELPDKVTAEQDAKIRDLLQKRLDKRMPLPYLTNIAWFMQHQFYVDQRVLIPRSPFAAWIENGFNPWINEPNKVQRILDIGTGSGSIAICCALVFENAVIDAVDLSLDALSVAEKNIKNYQLQSRINLHHGDCYADLPEKNKFDFIISNPPYVAMDYCQELPEEYQHEPEMALGAEKSGLEICERIMRQAINYLAPGGLLFVEVGYNQQTLQDAHPELAFTWLDCPAGGEGIFMLSYDQLNQYYNVKGDQNG